MKIRFINFLIIYFLANACLGNNFTIITENTNYTKQDTLRYTIYSPLSVCIDYPATAYITLRNEKQALVKSQIVKLSGGQTHFAMPLSALDSGFYFLSVYSSANTLAESAYGNTVCIAVDMPYEEWDKLNKPVLQLYPEGGKALLNFKNRFAVSLKLLSGNPLSEKLYFRNKEKKLVAIGKPNTLGWCAVDIPCAADDTIYIFDARGKEITRLINNTDKLFSHTGYSLHAYEDGTNLMVDMMKGQLATGHTVYFELYYKEKLLAESTGRFRDDTTIVTTAIPAAAYINRLLRLVLKDEKANVLAERFYIINKSDGGHETAGELFCNDIIELPGYYLLADANLPDALIAGKSKQGRTISAKPEKGFTLSLTNSFLKNRSIDYSIYGRQNELLQIGSAKVDSSGNVVINECDFPGEGVVKFYENKKEVSGFQQSGFPIADQEKNLLQSIFKEINVGERPVLTKSDALKDDTLPVVTMKNVTVQADKKSRLNEVEQKYVRNGMFNNRNGTQMIVEDDPTAINYSVLDYLMKYIPGLMIRNRVLQYRQGYLEFYIDEMLVTDVSGISMNDIGFIKFFNSPISSGLSAQRGGALVRGSSFAAGLQGSVAIYTKKGSIIPGSQAGSVGVRVNGYAN